MSNHCLCLLAGMAELHPEECGSSLYRVGQWGQVGDTTFSFISSLFAISHFPVSPVLHHFTVPSFNLFGSGDREAFYDSGLGGKKIKKEINGCWGEVEVELGRVRVDYLWVQVSVQYLPSGIWEEERGLVEGERASDTWEMALDVLLSFCQCLSFCFIYV